MPIRIQRYDDGHGPSGLCPSYGFFATIGLTSATTVTISFLFAYRTFHVPGRIFHQQPRGEPVRIEDPGETAGHTTTFCYLSVPRRLQRRYAEEPLPHAARQWSQIRARNLWKNTRGARDHVKTIKNVPCQRRSRRWHGTEHDVTVT